MRGGGRRVRRECEMRELGSVGSKRVRGRAREGMKARERRTLEVERVSLVMINPSACDGGRVQVINAEWCFFSVLKLMIIMIYKCRYLKL